MVAIFWRWAVEERFGGGARGRSRGPWIRDVVAPAARLGGSVGTMDRIIEETSMYERATARKDTTCSVRARPKCVVSLCGGEGEEQRGAVGPPAAAAGAEDDDGRADAR